jgi:restriction system protein
MRVLAVALGLAIVAARSGVACADKRCSLKLKMAPNSLFAILLRSPWWASLAIAVVLALLARMLLPEAYAVAGMLGAFPFVVIAAMAVWKQRGTLKPVQLAQGLQRIDAMDAREFVAALEAAFRGQGFEVQRLKPPATDLVLSKGGGSTLVSWRRWKAASLGIEPLRELHAAQRRQQADASLCIARGEISDKARSFAKEQGIRLVEAAELAQMLHATGALPKA